jgi:hypothetical protein
MRPTKNSKELDVLDELCRTDTATSRDRRAADAGGGHLRAGCRISPDVVVSTSQVEGGDGAYFYQYPRDDMTLHTRHE